MAETSKSRLTKRALEAAREEMLAAGESRRLIWDAEVKGFGARLSKSGIALFLNYVAPDGKARRINIAALEETTIDQARRRAAEMRVGVRAGSDPIEERRAKRKADDSRLTVAKLAERWMAKHEDRWRPATLEGYRHALHRHAIPAVGDRAVADMRKGDWADLLEKIGASSAANAALTFRTLSSMLNWAADLELIEAVTLPRASRVAPPVPPRERVLTDAELAAIWKATDSLTPRTQGFARWMILSAMRRSAGQRLRWDWVREGSSIEVPREEMKGDRPHVVPLSRWAQEQLAPAFAQPKAGPFVFSDGPGEPNRAKRTLETLIARSEIKDWSWHDLRRSFRTWCSRSGVPAAHAEAALAHVAHLTALDRAYDRHDFACEAGRALLGWQEHVKGLIEGHGSGNVVKLTDKRVG